MPVLLKRVLPCVLAIAFVVALSPRPASAKREYLEKVAGVFGLKDNLTGKCLLCHAVQEKDKPGKGNLGMFGKDIKGAFDSNDQLRIQPELAVVKNFEKDSDGDGALNREELALGTFPGDKTSIPDKVKLDKYRKDVLEAAKKRAAGKK